MRIFFSLILAFMLSPSLYPDDVYVAGTIERNGIYVEVSAWMLAAELQPGDLFAVYERKMTVINDEIYAGFVDSVVFKDVTDKGFFFAFLWDGAGRNMKSGYILVRTGRMLSPVPLYGRENQSRHK